MKKKILFVCTGNTCRSVIAESLFKKMVAEEIRNDPENEILKSLDIASAGIAPLPGMNTAPGTLKVLREKGIDASRHRARRLTSEEAEEASLILVMEERHLGEAIRIAGSGRGKIFLLGGFSGGMKKDIPDPFGSSAEVYSECRDEIEKNLEKLLEKIKNGEILL